MYDVVALGELLIDFTPCGINDRELPVYQANPGGAPCNVLSMLSRLGRKTSFIGKVGHDMFGKMPHASGRRHRRFRSRRIPGSQYDVGFRSD